MPPITQPLPPVPRIVCYYQTHDLPSGKHISILPLLTEFTGITHIILAAIHLNAEPGNITLNDHPPSHSRFELLWEELDVVQFAGIPVLGMLGGAAKGTFTRLDGDARLFEAYYVPLRDMIRKYKLDGLDLDVEESMSLAGVMRLIDRLKADFGDSFLLTLAPVATALQAGHHLSGFDYEALEVMRGPQISWYNTQFYCGWGDMQNTRGYDMIMGYGWPAHKVVVGLITNPGNGSGYVAPEVLAPVLVALRAKYPGFGGVMGWEYFNSIPGDVNRPWEWAAFMARAVGIELPSG